MKQYIDIIRNLRRVAGRRKHLDYLLLCSSAAYNLVGLLPPLATAGIIRMIGEDNYSGIWIYVGMYIVFYVFYFGFMRINNYAYTKIAEFYHISLQERVFKAVEKTPEILDRMPMGRVLDTFADDIRWVVDGVNVATEAALQMVRLLIIFVIFLTNDLLIGMIAILIDVIYLLLLNGNAKKEARRYANARRAEDKAISAFSEMANIREETLARDYDESRISETVSEELMESVDNFEANEQWAKMEKSFPEWRREYRKKRQAIARRDTLWAAIPYIGKIALYALLAKMVIDGQMGLDVLVLLIGYFEMTINCMVTMTTHLLALSNYGVRIERIKKLL